MNSLTTDEKNLLIDALGFYSEEHSWDMLPTDDKGEYYDSEPDSYDARMANLVSNLINKLAS